MSRLSVGGVSRSAADTLYPAVFGSAPSPGRRKPARARVSARDVRYDGVAVMVTPPTVGAWAAATAIASAKAWPSITNSGSARPVQKAHFAYSSGASIGDMIPWGTSFPDYHYVGAKTVTNGTAFSAHSIEFMFDGTTFEVLSKGLAGYGFRLWVDGQIVGFTASTTGGADAYLPVTFATRAVRRIRLDSAGGPFGGLMTGPNDSVWKPGVNGPRVIIIGDSYMAGTGATSSATSMARTLAAVMNWQDCWSSSIGGTGYLNAGTASTFRTRLATDVIGHAPDLVIWAGGHNDTASSQAAIQAEAALCFAQLTAALPDCQQIVLAPLWAKGVASYTAGLYGVRDGLLAAASAAGLPFVDLLEIPLDAAAISTTLSSAANAVSTISLPTVIPIGSTVHVGTYPAGERRKITNVSGAGPYTHTLSTALTGNYASGSAVTEVGAGLYTGSGRVGATTGDGNGDLLTFTDDAHPSQAGHEVFGLAIATELARYALAAA